MIAFLIAFFVLWIFFVNVMWLKHNKEKIPKYLIWPLTAFAAIGFLYDVIFNIVYGSIMFIQMPDFKGAHGKLWVIPLPTLSERMKDILRAGHNGYLMGKYRWYLSYYICRYLVEPWDKNHCGLEDITSGWPQ